VSLPIVGVMHNLVEVGLLLGLAYGLGLELGLAYFTE